MSDPPIELREPVVRLTCRVIDSDTDAGGVIYSGNYLRFMEMGRAELMRSLAISVAALRKEGIFFPITESHLRYVAYGHRDDLLTIATSLAELTPHALLFHYRISCQREHKELLLVEAFTKHACADRHHRFTPVPEKILTQINRHRFGKTE